MMFQSSTLTLNSEFSENNVPDNLYTISTVELSNGHEMKNEKEIKIYKRRFWMMLLYCLLSTLGAMLFPQYVSMANITGCYYGVSQNAVNWTTQICLAVYIVLVVPASLLMNYIDLRWTFICGSTLNTVACILQFLTLKPDGFPFVMLSSFFGATGGLFIMGLGPYLVARWFPSHELSRACAFGVFGNEIGVSIGLIFSPLLVATDCALTEKIEEGKRNVAFILTTLNAVVLILILFTFQNKPDLPPNVVQLEKKVEVGAGHTAKVILNMLKNPNYILIFILTGLLSGTFYAFTTTANDLMIRFFPGKEVEVAWITTFFTIMGIIGSFIGGFILDYTKKFKETAIVYSIMSLLLFAVFSGLLHVELMWVQFISTGLLGFFLAGFLPIGLEYGVEITFPASEMISSNLLFWSMQMFGLILIQLVSQLLDNYGVIASNTAVGFILLISSIIASFLTRNYKRSKRIFGEEMKDVI